uniref:Uncharacterized protein n=1 Tax=Setaria viridis TaxID=4556 RepID=A0A4U6TPW5_SETVI|nr:hypothetical protein SEVIR_7G018910v2 [Setaria viridis]
MPPSFGVKHSLLLRNSLYPPLRNGRNENILPFRGLRADDCNLSETGAHDSHYAQKTRNAGAVKIPFLPSFRHPLNSASPRTSSSSSRLSLPARASSSFFNIFSLPPKPSSAIVLLLFPFSSNGGSFRQLSSARRSRSSTSGGSGDGRCSIRRRRSFIGDPNGDPHHGLIVRICTGDHTDHTELHPRG